jgi:hypothetical protein
VPRIERFAVLARRVHQHGPVSSFRLAGSISQRLASPDVAAKLGRARAVTRNVYRQYGGRGFGLPLV